MRRALKTQDAPAQTLTAQTFTWARLSDLALNEAANGDTAPARGEFPFPVAPASGEFPARESPNGERNGEGTPCRGLDLPLLLDTL